MQPFWPALGDFNRGAAPLGMAALRLATLAFAPPSPRGLEEEGKQFTESNLHRLVTREILHIVVKTYLLVRWVEC